MIVRKYRNGPVAAPPFVRKTQRRAVALSAAALRHLGEYVQVEISARSFRLATCAQGEPHAYRVTRYLYAGYVSCSALVARLPVGVRIPVTVQGDSIEGQFPEVHDDSVQ